MRLKKRSGWRGSREFECGDATTASFEAKIQNKSQEEIGKVMAIEVGDLLKRKEFCASRGGEPEE